jgi:general secretion pathway protein B
MSFILDALKKSEAERQRQAGPALIEMRIVRPTRRLPAWAIIAGTLLGVGVLALAWVALRKPAPAAAGVAATAAPAAGAGSAAAAPAATNAGAAPIASGAGVVAAPVAAAPAGGGGVVTMQDAAPALTAPAASTRPAASAAAAPAEDNPADEAPAETPSTGAGAMGGHVDTRALRNYSELGGSMPELRLDLHVYDAKPAERYAFINMHKLREGDTTPEGVLVKAITPEGVVLEYRGTEFLLGR